MSEGWDFTKLPKVEHDSVVSAFYAGDVRTLMRIHDQYELSNHSYCCDHNGLLAWFKAAIDNGTINASAKNPEMAR